MEAIKVDNELLSEEEKLECIQDEKRKLIIITGFGLFEGHEEKNASWEAVRLLPNLLEHNGEKFDIEKIQIPVEYEAVDNSLEQIWKRNPVLVIHVGVHGQSSCIRVEKLAYNHKFSRADYAGKRLKKPTACLKNCDGIHNDVKYTCLKVDKICNAACVCRKADISPLANDETHTDSHAKVKTKKDSTEALAVSSKDVGNYLCGYIYIKSLDYDDKRTLFVHVPPVEHLSSELVCDCLLEMTKECIRQLKQDLKLL